MRSQTTNALRRTLDTLETRDVCSANPAVALVGTAPAMLPSAQMRIMDPSPVAGDAAKAVAAPTATTEPTAGARSLVGHESVLSIRNTTRGTLRFTLQWEGSSVAKSYAIPAGQTWRFWNTTVQTNGGWSERARFATIRFDANYAPGYQGKAYRLSSRMEIDGPGAPTGFGERYHFTRLGSNVLLYRG